MRPFAFGFSARTGKAPVAMACMMGARRLRERPCTSPTDSGRRGVGLSMLAPFWRPYSDASISGLLRRLLPRLSATIPESLEKIANVLRTLAGLFSNLCHQFLLALILC